MAPALFTSRRLTDPGEYTKQIEGPAVDAAGTLFVMNLKVDDRGTGGFIGKLGPGTTKSVQFARLPNGSVGSGARFDRGFANLASCTTEKQEPRQLSFHEGIRLQRA